MTAPTLATLPSPGQRLEALWAQSLSGRALLAAHTREMDRFIAGSLAAATLPEAGLALVALGGYGRCELFAYSDVDLLFLHDGLSEEELGRAVEAVLYPLWDSGVDVGHGVRTVEACLDDAEQDFTLLVALLDSRLVAGDPALFQRVRAAYQERFVDGRRRQFVTEMIASRRRRHEVFGAHTYLLEPHLKESRGGLRDIQAMLWTARVVFGLADLGALVESGVLEPSEGQACEAAWEELARVRNRLHRRCNRRNDQLFLEHQAEVAADLGYRDQDGLLAVEHFMRQLHGHLHAVTVAADLFFEHAEEVLGLRPSPLEGRRLEPGLAVRAGSIHFEAPATLERRPLTMMRAFVQAAATGLPLHHRTHRIIRERLHLIGDGQRRSRRLAAGLFAILESSHTGTVLTAMLETGMLAAVIPEFAPVVCLAQHDVYHVATVDRHSIATVVELMRLREEEVEFFSRVENTGLLMLAGLLHDIGKGRGRGHAERGAQLAEGIGRRLGLTGEAVATLVFLVGRHVFLMDTALRRDLDDERFIERCSREVGDHQRLAMLFLLTKADSRATGPAAWSDWKGALIRELHDKIALHLDETPRPAVEIARGKAAAERALLATLVDPRLWGLVAELPEDYLAACAAPVVSRHLELRELLSSQPAVVRAEPRGGVWSVTVLARDRLGLLARIVGSLALHGLEVVAAQIFTWPDGTAVDLLDVVPTLDLGFEDLDWLAVETNLGQAVANRLALGHRLAGQAAAGALVRRRQTAARLRPQPRVVLDNATSDLFTVVEVYAPGRASLLYNITRTLAELGISIFRARIGPERDRVVNVFYVLDETGARIVDPAFEAEVRAALLHAAAVEAA
ncbi:MAG: [protein-PII] uridylyltransferase [Thermodesulfobacteriota bacterium]